MTFFNLTMMGYDNRFKSLNRLQSAPSSLAGQHQPNAVEKQLAKEMAGDLQSREWVDDSVSNLTYHTLRHMHVRGGKEPHEQYRQPLTAAQQYGWWMKDQPLKTNVPWVIDKRHVHPQSEMTKFVDDMVLTDRYFKLF